MLDQILAVLAISIIALFCVLAVIAAVCLWLAKTAPELDEDGK